MDRKMKNQAGFTLIELMVTIAVAIVLIGIGIPLFDTMMANNRAVTQTNMFVTAINLTKSEAVSKNMSSTICADADGDPATFVCGDQDDWPNGWFVFNDENANATVDAGDAVIKVWGDIEPGTSIVTTVGATGSVSYNSLGEKVGVDQITFRMAQVDNDGNIATSARPRCIYLNPIGQLRTARITGSTGDRGEDISAATCP